MPAITASCLALTCVRSLAVPLEPLPKLVRPPPPPGMPAGANGSRQAALEALRRDTQQAQSRRCGCCMGWQASDGQKRPAGAACASWRGIRCVSHRAGVAGPGEAAWAGRGRCPRRQGPARAVCAAQSFRQLKFCLVDGKTETNVCGRELSQAVATRTRSIGSVCAVGLVASCSTLTQTCGAWSVHLA